MSEESKGPGLQKSLGLFTVILVVISSIIGSGVFKKVAPMSLELGSPELVLACWFLAGLVTLLGSLTNAEVAGLIAEPGGQYVYFKHMYGKFFAYLYGWASFAVIQCATTAAVSYVFSQSLDGLLFSQTGAHLPTLTGPITEWSFWGMTPFANFGVKLLTIGLITILTVVNYRGVKYGGFITNLFASTVVIAIFGIIFLGLFLSQGSMANITSSVASSSIAEKGLFAAMFAAMVSAFWAYEGWNNVGFLGGEVINPKRNIPLAFIIGVLLVILLYLLVNLTYLFVLPIDQIISNHLADDNSITAVEVMRHILGNTGAILISILILVATFNCVNSSILTAPRIYYAMAKDKLFFPAVAKVHPTFHTPHIALIVSGIWSSILVLSGSFDQLTDMLVFAAFIFYGAGAFGVFVLRRKMPDAERPYKVIGYPVVPALFILFCITLVIMTLINDPGNAGKGLILILIGVPFYFLWNNSNKPVKE
ncbi:MAG: amino acid permease [Chitinophagales bacterium]|nr:amino acid permease [Chitinophagales bacterium]